MMDVISGAMGAFLIIMIVLARYYEGNPENSESVDKLQRELKKAKEKIEQVEKMFRQNGRDIDVDRILRELEEARRAIDDANRRMADLRDRLDQATAMKNRLQKDNDKLTERNNRLEWRLPFMVDAWFDDCRDVDVNLYIYTNVQGSEGKVQPYFDPNIKQTTFWTGDHYIDDPLAPGADIWMVRDVPGGNDYKLYYYIPGAKADAKDCKVGGGIFGSKIKNDSLPYITLSGKKPWELVGFLHYPEEGDFNVVFTEATEEQRAQERELVAAALVKKKEAEARRAKEKKEGKPEDNRRVEEKKTPDVKPNPGNPVSMVPEPKPNKKSWWNPWR